MKRTIVIVGVLVLTILLLMVGNENFVLIKERSGNNNDVSSVEQVEKMDSFESQSRGDNWFRTTVDSLNDVGKYSSIAVDVNGIPIISYVDTTNNWLMYAKLNGSTWDGGMIDNGNIIAHTSIALDPRNGEPHISYFRNNNLRHAYYGGTPVGWHIDTVDNSGGVGNYSSIKIDSSGNPHISYYDATNRILMYAKHDGNQWHNETADDTGENNAGNVGTYSSLTLDSANKAHISYYSGSTSNLLYVKETEGGGGWGRQTPDATGSDNARQIGKYTSIVLDSGDKPRISYYDENNKNLMFAYKDAAQGGGVIWRKQTIDQNGIVGMYTSISVGIDNHLNISYYDQTNGDLKIASNNSGGWVIKPVDTQNDVGLYSSMVMWGENVPYISYYDQTNGDLRFATIDNERPNLVDNTVRQVGTANPLEFNISATDNREVGSVHVNWVHGNNSDNMSLQKRGNNWLGTITTSQDTNDLTYTVYVRDVASNYAISAQKNVPVTDDDAPQFEADNSPREGYTGDNFTFKIIAHDNIGVEKVWVDWSFSDDSDTLYLTPGGDDTWQGDIHLDIKHVGPLEYTFQIQDGAQNTWNSTQISIPVKDNKAPKLIEDTTAGAPGTEEVFIISAEIMDNIGISQVELKYSFNGDDWLNESMVGSSGNLWESSLTIPKNATTLEYSFHIFDVSGHDISTNFTRLQVRDTIAPTADAGEDLMILENEPITFKGNNSHDNIGITRYSWTFDYDGAMKELEGEFADFTFAIPGTYIITLTVTDGSNNTNTDEVTVTVLKEIPFKAIPAVNGNPIGANENLTISLGTGLVFDARNSTGDITEYVWNGENEAGAGKLEFQGAFFVHIFDIPGIFTVTLTVSNPSSGENDSISFKIIVEEAGMDDSEDPIVLVSINGEPLGSGGKYTVQRGDRVILDGRNSTDDTGIEKYEWSADLIDNPLKFEGGIVTHKFLKAGSYNVTLTVTDKAGKSASMTFTIIVEKEDIVEQIFRIGPIVDAGSNPLEGITVQFMLGPDSYSVDTDGSGFAKFALSPDDVPDGTEITATNGQLTFTWNQGDNIPVFDESNPQEHEVPVGPVLDADGDPVEGAEVKILIDGNPYSVETDEDGMAIFRLPVNDIPGGTRVTAVFDGETKEWKHGSETIPAFSSQDEGIRPVVYALAIIVPVFFVILLLILIVKKRKRQKEIKERMSELKHEIEREEELERIGRTVQAEISKGSKAKEKPAEKEQEEPVTDKRPRKGKRKEPVAASVEPKATKPKTETKATETVEEPSGEAEVDVWGDEDYMDDELPLPPPPEDLKEHLGIITMEKVPSHMKNILPGYIITDKLGSGGFATVYKAINKDGDGVAIKLPKFLDETIDSSVLKKFQAEADIWRKLKHKNIVTFLDSNIRPVPYMTIELMEGGNLDGLLKDHRLSVKEAKPLILQILDGLSYAHRMACVHRDIKPENILFTKDGVPKIADWGIGKFMADESVSQSIGTKGTFSYAAPEQFDRETYGDVDWSTDLFQVGIVFYQMLTGVNPFLANELARVMGLIMNKTPDPPSSLNPEISPELDEIVMKCLEKKKEDRWRSTDVIYSKLKEMEIRKHGNLKKYRRSLERALKDGVISEDEDVMLAELREHMSISDTEHSSLVDEIMNG